MLGTFQHGRCLKRGSAKSSHLRRSTSSLFPDDTRIGSLNLPVASHFSLRITYARRYENIIRSPGNDRARSRVGAIPGVGRSPSRESSRVDLTREAIDSEVEVCAAGV
jgi:hypothetical protein